MPTSHPASNGYSIHLLPHLDYSNSARATMPLPISSATTGMTASSCSPLQEIVACDALPLYATPDPSRCPKVFQIFLFRPCFTYISDLHDVGSLAKKATSLSIPLASLKFPPITSISYSTSRSKDWDDIFTAHTDETFARSWTMLGKKLGKYSFGFADPGKGKAKAKQQTPLGSVKVDLE